MTREQRIRLAMAFMRRSHATYAQAVRLGTPISDELAVGERAYQRWRKQLQRHTPISANPLDVKLPAE